MTLIEFSIGGVDYDRKKRLCIALLGLEISIGYTTARTWFPGWFVEGGIDWPWPRFYWRGAFRIVRVDGKWMRDENP